MRDTFRQMIEDGGEAQVIFRIFVQLPWLHTLGVAIAMDDVAVERFEAFRNVEFIHRRPIRAGGLGEGGL